MLARAPHDASDQRVRRMRFPPDASVSRGRCKTTGPRHITDAVLDALGWGTEVAVGGISLRLDRRSHVPTWPRTRRSPVGSCSQLSWSRIGRRRRRGGLTSLAANIEVLWASSASGVAEADRSIIVCGLGVRDRRHWIERLLHKHKLPQGAWTCKFSRGLGLAPGRC